MFGLCIVGMRVTLSGICSHCFLGVVISFCVFLCVLVGRVWVCCIVDLLLCLSGFCLIGGCGLRVTHAGLLQTVSDSSTVAPFFLWLCLCFVVCHLFFSLLLLLCCSLLCCDCGCGCGRMWIVLLLLVCDFCLVFSVVDVLSIVGVMWSV